MVLPKKIPRMNPDLQHRRNNWLIALNDINYPLVDYWKRAVPVSNVLDGIEPSSGHKSCPVSRHLDRLPLCSGCDYHTHATTTTQFITEIKLICHLSWNVDILLGNIFTIK